MDTKSITAVIIGLMVSGLILVAFVPIFTEVTATEKTFTNEGLIDLNLVDNTYEETIVWDYTEPTKLTIGTDEVDLPTSTSIAITFMGNEDFFVRFVYVENASFIQLYRTSTTSAFVARETNEQSLTMTIANGEVTFDNGGTTTVSVTYDKMYCICAGSGDYVLKDPSSTAYLLKDSDVYAHGGTYLTGVTFYTLITGTPEDGFTRIVWPDSAPITYTDMTSDLDEVNGYIGLYSLEKFTYTITNSNTSATGNVVYSQFVVPTEVTAELSVHGDDVFNNVINIIPLLAGVGLLMAGVYYFISRK